jgi:hypothetical protein
MRRTKLMVFKISGKPMLRVRRMRELMLKFVLRVLVALEIMVRMEETAASENPHEPRAVGIAIAILRVCIRRVSRAISIPICPVAITRGTRPKAH